MSLNLFRPPKGISYLDDTIEASLAVNAVPLPIRSPLVRGVVLTPSSVRLRGSPPREGNELTRGPNPVPFFPIVSQPNPIGAAPGKP
jgi:hypothetical protein